MKLCNMVLFPFLGGYRKCIATELHVVNLLQIRYVLNYTVRWILITEPDRADSQIVVYILTMLIFTISLLIHCSRI